MNKENLWMPDVSMDSRRQYGLLSRRFMVAAISCCGGSFAVIA